APPPPPPPPTSTTRLSAMLRSSSFNPECPAAASVGACRHQRPLQTGRGQGSRQNARLQAAYDLTLREAGLAKDTVARVDVVWGGLVPGAQDLEAGHGLCFAPAARGQGTAVGRASLLRLLSPGATPGGEGAGEEDRQGPVLPRR